MVSRYDRQLRFAPLGAAGQERLRAAGVLVAGLGGVGGIAADLLARAGVGRLRLADRDAVEETNLQRQTLFDQRDAERGAAKTAAAAARLRAANPEVLVEEAPGAIAAASAGRLLAGMDLALLALDNLEGRLALHDEALRRGLPAVYAAAEGAELMVLAVRPGGRPCLRCLAPAGGAPGAPGQPPPAILGPAAAAAGAFAAAAALRLLSGEAAPPGGEALLAGDLWTGRCRRLGLAPRGGCPGCGTAGFARRPPGT